uniref:Formin-like protein n=1 Tax=Kalanchoe fedtschenkoi TaxID=63787 RepID=A0A7N0UU72_KALFE
MALFRRFFYRKPPDRLLEIAERVYVFDCCFSTDVLEEDEYKAYMTGIVAQLQDHFPDASFMVFNFREGDKRSQISDLLNQYDMTVMDYPRQYEGCPMLPLEMIHHFLRSSESWLSLEGQQNVLLMHCERGGWPVLAFMLAGLLLYRKQYSGEQKTLEMVYKQAPKELLQLLSPLNPQPSQLRYLQYISRRNLGVDWPPVDTPLVLDCIMLRVLPLFDGGKGCRPVVHVYGQDPSTPADRSSKLLFSSLRVKKRARYYKQAECMLVKIDIHCRIQGDVVLECVHLDDDLVREHVIFKAMFNTGFVRSNYLTLSRDEVDVLWDSREQFPKDFKAEILFLDTHAFVASRVSSGSASEDGNETESASPDEFFEVDEIFSNVVDAHDVKQHDFVVVTDNNLKGASEVWKEDMDPHAFEDCTSDNEYLRLDGKVDLSHHEVKDIGVDVMHGKKDEKNDLDFHEVKDIVVDGWDQKIQSVFGLTGMLGDPNAQIVYPNVVGNPKYGVDENLDRNPSEEFLNSDSGQQSPQKSILPTSVNTPACCTQPAFDILLAKQTLDQLGTLGGSEKTMNPKALISRWLPPRKDSLRNSTAHPPSRYNSAPSALAFSQLNEAKSLPTASSDTAITRSMHRTDNADELVHFGDQIKYFDFAEESVTLGSVVDESANANAGAQLSIPSRDIAQTTGSLPSPLSQSKLVFHTPQPPEPPPHPYFSSTDSVLAPPPPPYISSSKNYPHGTTLRSLGCQSGLTAIPSLVKRDDPTHSTTPEAQLPLSVPTAAFSASQNHGVPPPQQMQIPILPNISPPPPPPPPCYHVSQCTKAASVSQAHATLQPPLPPSEPPSPSNVKYEPPSPPPTLSFYRPPPPPPPPPPSLLSASRSQPFFVTHATTPPSPPSNPPAKICLTPPSPLLPLTIEVRPPPQPPPPQSHEVPSSPQPSLSGGVPLPPPSSLPLGGPPPPPPPPPPPLLRGGPPRPLLTPPPTSLSRGIPPPPLMSVKAPLSSSPSVSGSPPTPSLLQGLPTPLPTLRDCGPMSSPSPVSRGPPPPPPPPPPSISSVPLRPPPPPRVGGPPPPPPPPRVGGPPPPPPPPRVGGPPPPPPPPGGGVPPAPPPPPPPGGRAPPPPPLPGGRAPPPPPPPGGRAPPPPPPPGGRAPPPPPPPGGRAPPPPPPPGGRGPPPPPPLGNKSPPPPPPPGGKGPPGPPAPPQAQGGSTPPPPPFVTKGSTTGTTNLGRGLSRNLGPTSAPRRSSLKPLHWSKVTRVLQGSLWEELQRYGEPQSAPEFDVSELEKLFSATVPTSDKSGGKGARRKSTGAKADKVTLIDLRRAYNTEIMLTKVKMPFPEMMAAVLKMDESVLDIDQVENLIKFCPTKEEMELLKNYTGDKDNLGKCEQFFLELMKVPRVESKLRVFAFKIQFRSQTTEFRNSLNTVNSACQEVRMSLKLKEIMKKILYLGNTLNQGTARGAAVGFKLDSLLKLTDTRASTGKMTLMHYLCKVLASKSPSLLNFDKDLVSLEAATKIQLKSLAEEMQAIIKGLEKVKQELVASENDGAISTDFRERLKDFVGESEAEVAALTTLYSVVGRNADALAQYFGEDPARYPFEQVTATLINFVRLFKKAHEENIKQAELEKKKAEKEAEMEKAKGINLVAKSTK